MGTRSNLLGAKIHYVVFGLKIVRQDIREMLVFSEMLDQSTVARLEKNEALCSDLIRFYKELPTQALYADRLDR